MKTLDFSPFLIDYSLFDSRCFGFPNFGLYFNGQNGSDHQALDERNEASEILCLLWIGRKGVQSSWVGFDFLSHAFNIYRQLGYQLL
jgi:hypothetical protein